MTYEVYRYIFFGGAILAGIMLIVAIVLFIFLHIPRIIGDLTGANARKAIAQIRNQNEQTGEKAYNPDSANRRRGKRTDRISPSGRLLHTTENDMDLTVVTEKINTQKRTHDFKNTGKTTVLDTAGYGSNETTVLDAAGYGSNETTVLDAAGYGSNETIVLEQENIFDIEFEITYIFSDEVVV